MSGGNPLCASIAAEMERIERLIKGCNDSELMSIHRRLAAIRLRRRSGRPTCKDIDFVIDYTRQQLPPEQENDPFAINRYLRITLSVDERTALLKSALRCTNQSPNQRERLWRS